MPNSVLHPMSEHTVSQEEGKLTMATTQPIETSDVKEKVLRKVREHYPNAKNILFYPVVDRFIQAPVYYVEWDDENTDESDRFCYVLGSNDPELYDDGIQVIQRMKQLLDEKKTILAHIGEFSFNDMIGAVIAVVIVLIFIEIILVQKTVDKDFLGLVLLVAGYYFGKAK